VSPSSAAGGRPVIVTPPLLRDRPLPAVGFVTDKGVRGRVVVIGGTAETPGGVLLAGLAALRVGAGKLQLATSAEAAVALAVAVPEARVLPLPSLGSTPSDASDVLCQCVSRSDAVLVGTGSLDVDAAGALLRAVVPALADDAALVVDAGAISALRDEPDILENVRARTVVTPNPPEAAQLLGVELDEISSDPEGAVRDAVALLGCVVALRAPETLVAAPGSHRYLDRSGHPALGTSGSGDVFAGVLAGLLARGADPLDATLWAVQLHGRAGEQAAARVGGQGILARELVDELPRVLVGVAGATV
jgi:ADP-dependent NAD(P)H-hydrate dehydratase